VSVAGLFGRHREVQVIDRGSWKSKTALFLSSQVLSLLGSSLVQYALMWYVTLETKSGLMMTVYVVCGFAPTFVLSPFAGVWADRYDRKKLIVLSDALIALVTLALAAVFAAGGKALWLIFLAAAIRAVGTALQGPAVGAIIPQFVPEDQRMRVNGISSTMQASIMLVSPILSGAMISLWPMQAVFFADVLTAALAITILLLFLKIPPHQKASEKQEVTYLADLRLGFRYIREHRYLVSFFTFLGLLLFLISPGAFLTPLQVTRTYGSDVWRLTAIEVVFSVGMMLGGAVISAWGGFKNRVHTMLLATSVMAVATLALGLAPVFWLYLVFMGLFGVAVPLFNTPSAVLIQEHVEENYLGRVFSILTMLMTSVMPLGMLVFGPLAELIRIEWILLGTGALMLLYALRVLGNRRLLEAGRRVEPSVQGGTTPSEPSS
jgi:DHA3 family macrolide efflux protein-like MFS transporter